MAGLSVENKQCYLHSFGADWCYSGVAGAQKETPLSGLVWLFHWGFVGFLWELCHSQGTGGGGIRNPIPPKQNHYNSTTISPQKSHNNELTQNQVEQNHNNSEHKHNTSECFKCALCVRKQKSSDIRITFIQDHLLELPEHILDTVVTIVESATGTKLKQQS